MSELGIRAIFLGDNPEALIKDFKSKFPQADLAVGNDQSEKYLLKVVDFIDKFDLELELPLDIQGTKFQQQVWQTLRKIPVGSTASYTDIAVQIGAPKSIRAVARACAANILAIAIPCHRAVRNDGALSGYRWGKERKRVLLERENRYRKG